MHFLHLWSIGQKGFLTDFEKMDYLLIYGPERNFLLFLKHRCLLTLNCTLFKKIFLTSKSTQCYSSIPIIHLLYFPAQIKLMLKPTKSVPTVHMRAASPEKVPHALSCCHTKTRMCPFFFWYGTDFLESVLKKN